ncbi:hypothetical protein F9K91_02100 [Brucella tritici]|uniref:Uncharacterized protein n=1 Tax=Brucella tritici TaxID=94626 RepID=A0A833FNR0_9HYPH|nr:hypothetical protein [Brucella tritici]KAB2666752.1 hypothetical protein F9K91_02100 [Brucella tritici]
MADLPILFSAPMVRAILREIENPGTGKTQTRRIIKPQPTASGTVTLGDRVIEAAEWQIREGKFLRINEGDRLYVREAWRVSRMHDQTAPRDLKPRTMTVFFEAGGSIANQDAPGDWKSAVWPEIGERPDWAGKFRQAMHMPRWASRITLEVTGVKVERLQDISEEDAIAEGIDPFTDFQPKGHWRRYRDASGLGYVDCPIASFASLWTEINGPAAWEANPWVAAYTFRPILGNIDQIARAA